jgi:hypothetical protein
VPIRWYQPTGASGPIPCAWLVWLSPTDASVAGRWVEVSLIRG